MLMKKIYYALLSILLLFTLSSQSGYTQNIKQKPNIIYILADDLGYGDIKKFNRNSQISTPNLDRLASEGAIFTNAHSGSSVCTPTRYGILTGRYAFRSSLKNGVLKGYDPPLIEETRYTVANLAKAAGYQTAIIGKWHLGLGWTKNADTSTMLQNTIGKNENPKNINFAAPIKSGPNQLGFDYSYILPGSLDMAPYTFLKNGLSTNAKMIPFEGNSSPRGVFWTAGLAADDFAIEKTLDIFINEAKNYITKATYDAKPFFLYLPLTSPHAPWLPAAAFKNKSNAGIYGDFVMHTDDAVGQIMKTLDSLGISKNTLVVFTSDNGANWNNSDAATYPLHQANYIFKGQKKDIWDGGHHIPFIVRWPTFVKANSTSLQIICLTDLMATMAAITGQTIAKTSGPDSYNILPLLKGKNKAVRKSIIHHSANGTFAIRKGKWKLIDGQGSGAEFLSNKLDESSGQLYNMERDERETNNLYEKYPEVVKELKILLEKQKEQGYSNR